MKIDITQNSENNIISFWNFQNKSLLIQQIKIEFNILFLIVSPSLFNIALDQTENKSNN
ncbi:unnamed protein product [Paramecium sonneborni]|uniref:Uncharacterized protein n=1 Tax=Paramecium sonneborni TaxID=65129 RepID=A0A8S1P583_9CILI|nr:unnamed protein product [Paramecium sonneborni]